MRPTITEQLAGIRRILADVVAPEVQGAYPLDMLRGIDANLAMLERSWTQVVPFLAWDNTETARILVAAQRVVDAQLGARIGAAIADAEPDPLDVVALESHNTRLREVLADAVPVLAAGGASTADAYTQVCRHLRQRIDRFPLTLSAPMPGTAR